MCIKIPKPNNEYILNILTKTCDINHINYNKNFEIGNINLNDIVINSDNNIKKAINILNYV